MNNSFLKILSKKLSPKQNIFKLQFIRYFILPVFALLTSLGIFYFMSALVFKGKIPTDSGSENVSISFLPDDSLEDLKLRSRHLPKEPEEKEPPPESPKLNIPQEIKQPELSNQLPQLELPDDFQSDAQGGGVSPQGIKDSAGSPLFQIQAVYPRKAAVQNIEGFVLLQFDITKTGQVDNVSVITASPPKIFNSSAVQALRKWKYKPKIVNGKAVRQKNRRVRLLFSLENYK